MLYADDADLISESAEGLAKMMTVTVNVLFEASGFKVSEKKTGTMLLRTPNQTPLASPLVIEAAGQRYKQTAVQFLYMGGLINNTANIMPEIERRVRLAWVCFDRFKLVLYDMETASFTLKVRMLKVRGGGDTLYGYVAWTFGVEHFAVLHSAHRKLLLRIIGIHRRQLTDQRISSAKALKKATCESVETTIRNRRLHFAGAVQRAKAERLTRWVMFGTMAGVEQPGPCRPGKTWA